MNGKKSKRVVRHCKVILVQWLSTLLPPEELNKLSINNCLNFVPEQTHFYANGTVHLNSYNHKWIKNKIKKLIKLFPHKAIESITLQDIEWIANKK